jgi:hypothetical protein
MHYYPMCDPNPSFRRDGDPFKHVCFFVQQHKEVHDDRSTSHKHTHREKQQLLICHKRRIFVLLLTADPYPSLPWYKKGSGCCATRR